MAEKKKLIDEAMIDLASIQAVLKANTKEILRATMHEEINAVVKESLNEADYDEEDVDGETPELGTDNDEVPALPMDDETPAEEPEMGGGMEPEMGGDMEPEMGGDMDTLDLTTASDDEVISVFKKLSGEDEIEIVSNSEVKIKDPQSGNEYVVKLGGGEPTETSAGIGSEEPMETPELGIGAEETEEEPEYEFSMGDEDETEDETPEHEAGETPGEEAAEEEDGDDDEIKGESVVYEIELREMENISTDVKSTGKPRTKGHDKSDEAGGGKLPSGDIEGQKGEKSDTIKGDNLTGGFTEKDPNGSKTGHAEHVMETEEEVNEEADAIEEKIQVGKGRNVTTGKTEIVGAGGKANNVKKGNVTAESVKLEVTKRYTALLSEVKALRQEREEFKANLGKFRDMLAEAVVYNSNLTYVVKLVTEHSTTKAEKENIMKRFDSEVTSLKESKKLYKTLANELASKKTITESVIEKTTKTQGSSVSQLNESTAYVDASTKRIIDLIGRVENR
jgi:hypothetical protein